MPSLVGSEMCIRDRLKPVAHMRLMCGSCRCYAEGLHCASVLSSPKLLASSSLHNSPRSFLHSSSLLFFSTQNTLRLLAPCLLPTCLRPLSRLSMRMHHLPAFNGRNVAAISLSKKHLLRSGQVKKRDQKGVPSRAKKTPADPEHLTTTNSRSLTSTSMLMGLVEST